MTDKAVIAAGRMLDPATYSDDPMDDVYIACREFLRLHALCKELDEELDGVVIPRSAASIANAIRSLVTG